MSRRNFGHRNGFKTRQDLQVMNFLARKNCTFSILFHHISSRKLAHSDTFFKELSLEPNLNLRICYQRYLGERIPEYDALGWTCEFFLKYFEKYGRVNFGVQQLPLFNLLKPEDIDWLSGLSWSEGGRWLNTRVPRNLRSHSRMSAAWWWEWAYGCHLETDG